MKPSESYRYQTGMLALEYLPMPKRPKHPAAVALAKARAAKLTPERRTEIAKQAAVARWTRKGK